jgi:hypothetical protein
MPGVKITPAQTASWQQRESRCSAPGLNEPRRPSISTPDGCGARIALAVTRGPGRLPSRAHACARAPRKARRSSWARPIADTGCTDSPRPGPSPRFGVATVSTGHPSEHAAAFPLPPPGAEPTPRAGQVLFARIYTEDGVNRRHRPRRGRRRTRAGRVPAAGHPLPQRPGAQGPVRQLRARRSRVPRRGSRWRASPASAIGCPKLGLWPLTCCFVVEGSPTPGQSGIRHADPHPPLQPADLDFWHSTGVLPTSIVVSSPAHRHRSGGHRSSSHRPSRAATRGVGAGVR